MDIIDKPVVFYTETNPIIVGHSAYICAHNHPRRPERDDWSCLTSTVLAYDIITGEIETKNTLYKVRSQLKSINKSAHQVVRDGIQQDPHRRRIPLSACQIASRSDGIKHDLTELGESFKYITCDTCDIKSTCKVAFDLYCTDGDCLLK